jgi:hypothetical protein
MEIEEAAHAAARYVVRAAGANARVVDAVLASQAPGGAVATASPFAQPG